MAQYESETSERHRRVIRAGLRAGVADPVRESARTTAADAIGVETIIRGGDDQHAIAVNINVA